MNQYQIDNSTNIEYPFFGKHFIASYINCDYNQLINIKELKYTLQKAVESSGATILKHNDFIFEPNGYTSTFLLSESHASIHTYPEFKSCFVDLFTCGNKCTYDKFDKILSEYLKPDIKNCSLIERSNEINIKEI